MRYIPVYFISYAILIGIAAFIAYGSFEYYVITSKASLETVKAFLASLPFPSHYMYYLFPFKEWDKYIPNLSKSHSIRSRIALTVFVGLNGILFASDIVRAVAQQNTRELILDVIGVTVVVVGVVWGWRFGRKLKDFIPPTEYAN
jgi:hypothetical protein